jgi:hypothetical protein
MIKSKNGSSEENAGIWLLAFPRTPARRGSAAGSRLPSLRASHRPAKKKKIENPPMTSSSPGSKTTSADTRNMHMPVASSVSTSTDATAASDALNTATPTAIASTSRMAGQMSRDTASNL